MDYKNLFEKFNEGGRLLLPDVMVAFDTIPCSKNPTFEGVELKHTYPSPFPHFGCFLSCFSVFTIFLFYHNTRYLVTPLEPAGETGQDAETFTVRSPKPVFLEEQ